jgi:plastocyanin
MARRTLIGVVILVGALPCHAADDDKWSTVKGKVMFEDSKHAIPKRVVPDTKNAQLPPCIAKDKEFLTEDWVVNPKNKGVRDVVVWIMPEPTADEWKRLKLKANEKGRLRDFPSFKPDQLHPDLKEIKQKTVEIDQPCCRFVPHVLGIRVGQTLVVKNSAAFGHNANFTSSNNGQRNPLIPDGKQEEFPIKEPERAEVTLTCNIHPWMSASIRVFDHPYFAVTNENGEYEIPKVPVGKHRIFVWHRAGSYSGGDDGRFGYEVTITPKKTEVKEYSVTEKPAEKK